MKNLLEQRINTKRNNEVRLELIVSKDLKHLLIGDLNYRFDYYQLIDNKYIKTEEKLNLSIFKEMSYIRYVSLHDDIKGVYRFSINGNRNLFFFNLETNEVVFEHLKYYAEKEELKTNLYLLQFLSNKTSYDYYGIVDEIYFKLDDVVYILIKDNSHYNAIHNIEEICDDNYDSAWFSNPVNYPSLDLFNKEPLDKVIIKSINNYDENDDIHLSGIDIVSLDNHSYLFAGEISYFYEDCSMPQYYINPNKKESV